MVKFSINELIKFLDKHGFKDTLDNVVTFMDLHPCSDNVVYFDVDMFASEKPRVYAIVRIDIKEWLEELTSDNPA
jgi:hypothetical protein